MKKILLIVLTLLFNTNIFATDWTCDISDYKTDQDFITKFSDNKLWSRDRRWDFSKQFTNYINTKYHINESYDYWCMENKKGKYEWNEKGGSTTIYKDVYDYNKRFLKSDRTTLHILSWKPKQLEDIPRTKSPKTTAEKTNTKKDGYRVETYKSGNKYEGSFKNGKRHGQGIYTYTNGNKYEGNWKNGKRHGQGVYIFANGETEGGQWVNGKCPNCIMATTKECSWYDPFCSKNDKRLKYKYYDLNECIGKKTRSKTIKALIAYKNICDFPISVFHCFEKITLKKPNGILADTVPMCSERMTTQATFNFNDCDNIESGKLCTMINTNGIAPGTSYTWNMKACEPYTIMVGTAYKKGCRKSVYE